MCSSFGRFCQLMACLLGDIYCQNTGSFNVFFPHVLSKFIYYGQKFHKLGSRFYVLRYFVTTETVDDDCNYPEGITIPFQMFAAVGPQAKNWQIYTQQN